MQDLGLRNLHMDTLLRYYQVAEFHAGGGQVKVNHYGKLCPFLEGQR